MISEKKVKSAHKDVPTLEELKKYYYQLTLIRRFEERAGQLYGMGLIRGFCHLYIGQEAIIVGAKAAMQEGDALITTYRDHAHCLLSGMTARETMAELLGRAGGCSKGKGGSMHMFSTAHKFYGGHGIVGASVPLGAGIAFAEKYRGTNNICLTFFGDGAINQGQIYETFNMAALWKLPALFVVENNRYSMGTSVKRGCANEDLHLRGEPYGIKGVRVDGMNVLAVKEAMTKALAEIRAGGLPILLVVDTYRYRGHSMSDPAKYRSKDEVNYYKENLDPIEQIKRLLETHYKVTEEGLEDIDSRIKEEIDDCIEFSKDSPEPDESELFTDVYSSC